MFRIKSDDECAEQDFNADSSKAFTGIQSLQVGLCPIFDPEKVGESEGECCWETGGTRPVNVVYGGDTVRRQTELGFQMRPGQKYKKLSKRSRSDKSWPRRKYHRIWAVPFLLQHEIADWWTNCRWLNELAGVAGNQRPPPASSTARPSKADSRSQINTEVTCW